MKKTLYEQIVLLISFLKWVVLSSIVGVITALSTTLFLKTLGLTTDLIRSYQWYFLLLPLILFTSSFIVKYLAPDAEGHGTEKILEAVHKRHGKIKLAVVPVKLVATVITLAGGGSAGKEGPCAQIGAGLASGVADILRLNNNDRKKIVICGISAGFSTVFGTPLAGAIFAVEVLILGRIMNEYLFPALISSIVGFKTALLLGNKYHKTTLELPNIGDIDITLFLQSMLSGIFIGFVALILIETLKYSEKIAHKIKIYKPLKGLIGGAILVILVLLLNSQIYLGLGVETIDSTLEGSSVPHFAFLIKILFTAITLSMGGSGGVLTPIFFIGTTAGSMFASTFGLDLKVFSAIGLVALLAAATNTPIAATLMAIEMFGVNIAPYAVIACVVGYLISGHRSVYPSQVIGTSKSTSIEVPVNVELRDIKDLKIRKFIIKNKTTDKQ